MKLKLSLIAAPIFLSIISVASAASILTSNYAGADTSVVVDLSLNQVGTGHVAVGYFTITDAAILTSNAAQLASAFQILGSSGGTSYDVGGGYFMDGGFDLSASASTPPATPFVGKNVYLVVGNSLTLGTSSQAFIYKTNTLFQADPSSAATLDFSAGPPAGSAILGTTGITYTPYFSGAGIIAGNEVTTAYRMAAIPEPSAALLGAVGALALLRRRRI